MGQSSSSVKTSYYNFPDLVPYFGSTSMVQEGCDQLVELFTKELGSNVSTIYQVNKTTQTLSLISYSNLSQHLVRSMATFNLSSNEGGLLKTVLNTREPILIQNLEENPISIEFIDEIQKKKLRYALFMVFGSESESIFISSNYYSDSVPEHWLKDNFAKVFFDELGLLFSRIELKEKVSLLEKQIHVDRKVINQKSQEIILKSNQLDFFDTKLKSVVEVMLSAYSDLNELINSIFTVMSNLLDMETIGMGKVNEQFITLQHIYDKENILRVGDNFPAVDMYTVKVKSAKKDETVEMKNLFRTAKFVNHPVYMHLGFNTFFTTPIVIDNEPFGILFAASKDIKSITSFEEDLLHFLAQKISFELQKIHMENRISSHTKDVERSNQELKIITQLGAQLTSELNFDKLLGSILKALTDVTGCEDASLFLYDQNSDELVIRMVAQEKHKSIEGFRMPSTKGIAGWVFSNKQSQIVNSTKNDERHDKKVDSLLNHKTESILCSPLLDRDNMALGCIQLINKMDATGYVERDQNFLELLVPFISVALKNASLFTLEQETTRQAQEAQKLKSEFLSNMSHELRTPLTSIIAYTDIMYRDYDVFNELQKKSIDRIKISSQHLLNLINDILDLSKIEAGMMTIYKTEVDLHSIIINAVSTLEAQCQQKGLYLKYVPPEDSVITKTDEIRLKQIVINLISNAVKFTETGGITVTLKHDYEVVSIVVEDTGIGIPDESKQLIFESFRQADGSASRKAGGTGLGLSISQRIAKLLGGIIELESEVGKGSTFTIRLPYERGFV